MRNTMVFCVVLLLGNILAGCSSKEGLSEKSTTEETKTREATSRARTTPEEPTFRTKAKVETKETQSADTVTAPEAPPQNVETAAPPQEPPTSPVASQEVPATAGEDEEPTKRVFIEEGYVEIPESAGALNAAGLPADNSQASLDLYEREQCMKEFFSGMTSQERYEFSHEYMPKGGSEAHLP